MRIRRILFALPFFGCGFAAAAAPAQAGAFLAPPGQGEIITAASFSDSTRAFDADGRLVPISAYRKFELGTYVEYGLSDRVTLIAQPSADIVRQGEAQPVSPVAAGTDLGARVGLVTFDSTILSLQGLVHVPFTASSTLAGLFDQERVAAADLRLLLGRGFTIGSMTGFFDVEASHTWQAEALPEEWHADVTFGVRPQPKLLLMLTSYLTLAGNPGANCATYWSWLKLQPSVVYDVSQNWSVEAGFFATLIGQNAGRELGPMTALWYRF